MLCATLNCIFRFLFSNLFYKQYKLLCKIMKARLRLENLARKKSISNRHEKSTESLIESLLRNDFLNKRELNIIARGLDIKKPSRISSNGLINIFRRFLI